MRAVALLLCVCVSRAYAAPVCSSPPSTEKLAERVIASTVTVLAFSDKGIQGSGSGFFVGDGLIATNWHVVQGSKSLRVKLSDQKEPVAVRGIVAADLANDLALLALDDDLRALAQERALRLDVTIPKRGAKVYAFGSPRLLEATMSDGIVSAEREIEGAQRLQITAAVSPGSSGGPVTNECGDVTGIAYMKVRDSEALNFAIPAHFLKTLLSKTGEPRAAEVLERDGQATLRKVTASRLGVPDGIDPKAWVQIDPVTQRFFTGLERQELSGPDFFTHVGKGELLTDADNTLPVLFYASGAVCAGASLCACGLGVLTFPVGTLIGLPVGGVGGCASLGLGAAGFVLWEDKAAPQMTFDEKQKLAEAHNQRLLAKQKKSPVAMAH